MGPRPTSGAVGHSRVAAANVMMKSRPDFLTITRPDSPMAQRILVVDDEPMVRALITRALTDDGYEVVAVADGRAALDAARGAAVGFDLIVTNSYMPGLNGPELIARVRQDFPTLPILHIDDISHRRISQALPEDIPTVYKPFSVVTLRQAVRRLLKD